MAGWFHKKEIHGLHAPAILAVEKPNTSIPEIDHTALSSPLLTIKGVERSFQVGAQKLHVLKAFIWN